MIYTSLSKERVCTHIFYSFSLERKVNIICYKHLEEASGVTTYFWMKYILKHSMSVHPSVRLVGEQGNIFVKLRSCSDMSSHTKGPMVAKVEKPVVFVGKDEVNILINLFCENNFNMWILLRSVV